MLNQGSISVVNSTNVLNLSGSNISGIDTITSLGTLSIIGNSNISGNMTISGNEIVRGNMTVAGTILSNHATTAAININNTATAAQVATGYITSTSPAAVLITLPTGTLLGAALGAVRGSIFDLYIDNTLGASLVTVAIAAADGQLSAAAAASYAGVAGINAVVIPAAGGTVPAIPAILTGSVGLAGLLTVPAGATGLARFTLMFTSSTAYVFSRTA